MQSRELKLVRITQLSMIFWELETQFVRKEARTFSWGLDASIFFFNRLNDHILNVYLLCAPHSVNSKSAFSYFLQVPNLCKCFFTFWVEILQSGKQSIVLVSINTNDKCFEMATWSGWPYHSFTIIIFQSPALLKMKNDIGVPCTVVGVVHCTISVVCCFYHRHHRTVSSRK